MRSRRGPIARLLFLRRIRSLQELQAWPTIGVKLDAVLGYSEPLHPEEEDQLEEWARRWRRLSPELRAFYARWAPDDETAGAVLHRLLNGRRPENWQKRKLYQLWGRHSTTSCPTDIAPRV